MSEAKVGLAKPQLPSGDIDEKTAAFFTERLGFEVVARYCEQNFLIVRRGAAEIYFWQTPGEAEARERGAGFRYGLTKQTRGMSEMQVDDAFQNAIRFGEIS